MNLSDLNTTDASNAGQPMEVLHPATGEPVIDEETQTPVTITLVGRDSDAFRGRSKKHQNDALNKLAAQGRRRKKFDAGELEKEELETLVFCTKDWHGIILDAESLECTPENVRKVYERLHWLRDQVNDFIMDRSNFLGNS